MDEGRFEKAVAEARDRNINTHEIGTLSERGVHAALKAYFEPNPDCREIAIGRHFADIYRDGEIIEIQSRAFYKLAGKLRAFLPEYKVTVVYPTVIEKQISWVDPETGETTSPRRSPKHCTSANILGELYGIKEFLDDPNLTLCCVYIKTEETHLKCGRSKDGKRFGAKTISCFPTELCGLTYLHSSAELKKLIPCSLPERFCRKEFDKTLGYSGRMAWYALKTLLFIEAVREDGKEGKKIIYSLTEPL